MSNLKKDKFRTRANRKGLAIKGYDPVAYFTLNEPTKGSADITYQWSGAEWRFANTEHRDLFINDPAKYAPQFGGSCAVAAATGHSVTGSPKRWRIENGHLYLNKDRMAAALHKPLSNRIHRLSAELRGDRNATADLQAPATVARQA
ncbi:MAG: YHS domain-containing (seleno)protein [Acidimicrobiales bacterium]